MTDGITLHLRAFVTGTVTSLTKLVAWFVG